MTANSSVIIQGPPRTAARPLVRQHVARRSACRPAARCRSGAARRPARARTGDSCCRDGDAGCAGRGRPVRPPPAAAAGGRISMPSCGKARAISASSRGRSDAGAAPSNCAAAASCACPRSIDGSGWSGRWIRKLAVMIRCRPTIETTTSAAICPLMRLQIQEAEQLHDQLPRGNRVDLIGSTLGVNM